MADEKDKKIGEVPHLEQVTGKEKIPVSAEGEPRYIETAQIYDKEVTPYPKANQIVYTTTDGEVIELADANIVSNVYYKYKGYGVMTFEEDLVKSPVFYKNSRADYLESIKLPIGMTTISSLAFCKCHSLKNIEIPDTITNLGDDIFDQTKLVSFIIPEGITKLGPGPFLECENLQNVILPDTITDLSIVFRGCKNLTKITLPSRLKSLYGTFDGCTNLQNIKIPSLVNEIGKGTFSNCTSLTHITIPQSVTSIGNDAFANVTPFYFDTYLPNTQGWPAVNRLQTLILRYDGVVKDVDTYAGTFAKEPIAIPEASTLDLVDSPMPIDGAEPMPMSDIEGGIMPMLNTYVGTPNNWLKIYVPENRLKEYQETYPTLKSHFHPITGEDIYATRDDLKNISGGGAGDKKALFIDLWNDACTINGVSYGRYNPDTGFFELNEINDIGYEEALEIYNSYTWGKGAANSDLCGKLSISYKARTAMPIPLAAGDPQIDLYDAFRENKTLEAIRLVNDNSNSYVKKWNYSFLNVTKLKHIYGWLACSSTAVNNDLNLPTLETVNLRLLSHDIGFSKCSKLSYESFKYMVDYANKNIAFTITVHPDIYSALQGTAPEYPFNGGTQEEWVQLLEDATTKNIQFATA